MRVVVVPVLSDNYAYLIIDDATKQALAVDPAEAALVLAAAAQQGVRIVGVLTTHHHWDHAGGNSDMAAKIPGLAIYGGRLDNVQACTKPVDHKEVFDFNSIRVECLHTPGHTRGSISFYLSKGDDGVVFTGDTMFVGGCGRVFECTPADLHNSLVEVLGALPPTTQVYVGHDYTLKNLEFAMSVEPGNQNLKNMLRWAQEQKLARRYTVPSSLQNEWLVNPFMRAQTEEMRSVCPGCTPVEIFTRLRQQKNNF
uniref:hydroxyacylglutathione hydrolase n=1 Tax=Noctiluca scintillans TaxID=2966 RepID=A0A7S1AHG8_NOCSC|mmetsp:Transcript_46128/g.122268  ORF Transcript_46128/g.122268 Transcript_46128/m.122268 type:complete len:254 (+) Transcript_46128:61-822(+)|eukprot:CAMPEP_0194499334 /NCGR_PEP_ID=MMETSP0253-20130528/15673_1 /TAXON_ID=2966 /ORGANISM="Noctiluca scintillans" /LENGTH=253 /DNA_ID=CAMNT_0039341073 /DNA_START=15 /DNA_END=776 /DNA_ORIENTATION=-